MRKIIKKLFAKPSSSGYAPRGKKPTMPRDEQRQYRQFARDCINAAEPERIVEVASDLPIAVWHIPAFRREYFVALMMLRRYDLAQQFLRDTLAMGAFKAPDLLRMIGDVYLFEDSALLRSTAETLLSLDLETSHRIYVLNTVLNYIGETNFHSEAKLEDGSDSFDLHIYRSNVQLRRGNFEDQIQAFNHALVLAGLEPVIQRDTSRSLSATNIICSPHRVVEGPLVSIAMSTFNSVATVGPAVESLLAQTYKNIEILIVDDCSSDNTVELARHYERLDPRVRVFQQPVNGGTYCARNTALSAARGEYFTCNDSDDWAHPSKIETLVMPLLKDQSVIGTISKLVRVNENLGVKPKILGYAQEDASSLCYRREPVVSAIGYYDSVPFGADNEFRSRLGKAFEVMPLLVDKPLLVSDWSRSSLSGGLDHGFSDGGTRSIKRTKYRASYLERHARGELYVGQKS